MFDLGAERMAAENANGDGTTVRHATARRAALWVAILLGLGAATARAQSTLGSPVAVTLPIVGTWELVSLKWTTPDGRSFQPWGDATGRLTYDANGNVVALLMHERRNEAQSGSRAAPETLSQYSAYFGTYHVNAANGVITHQVTGSLNGENASGELQRTFRFEDGNLILGFTTIRDGVPLVRRLVWKRISSSPAN
jgi:hypothetical protein